MDSQLSDIRKEYKKGKLTRNTISENPFEQFARWLDDALHCGEDEPTAMIAATVSPDGQVHIEGIAERCAPRESDAYFSTRPYKSRIGARISPQSRVIGSRMEIIRAFVKEAAKLAGQTVQRPDNWGGFAVTPTRFEFWQGRESRLHDRFRYTLREAAPVPAWTILRLAP